MNRYNCAGIKPDAGYLQFCREITRDAGIVFFFDEIQSAFKKSLGGAPQDFGVVPDACTIGKVTDVAPLFLLLASEDAE